MLIAPEVVSVPKDVAEFSRWVHEFSPIHFLLRSDGHTVDYAITKAAFTVFRTYGADAAALAQIMGSGLTCSRWAITEGVNGPLVCAKWKPFTPIGYVLCAKPSDTGSAGPDIGYSFKVADPFVRHFVPISP